MMYERGCNRILRYPEIAGNSRAGQSTQQLPGLHTIKRNFLFLNLFFPS